MKIRPLGKFLPVFQSAKQFSFLEMRYRLLGHFALQSNYRMITGNIS